MDDLGSGASSVLSNSQSPDAGLIDEPRADLSMNINGHRIESITFDLGPRVTINGRLYNGTFSDAIKVCGMLPVRWNGMFD